MKEPEILEQAGTLDGRLANARRQMQKLQDKLDSGQYDQVNTRPQIAYDLGNWMKQVSVLQLLIKQRDSQT